MNNIKKYPNRIVIEMTSGCNLSCSMCPRHYTPQENNYISMKVWEKLILEIVDENPKAIVIPFWRGESLMHPDFCKMMEFALEKNLRIHLSTNGHYFNEKITNILNQIEFLTFSIHSKIGFENAKKMAKIKNSPTIQISFVDCEKTAENYLSELIKQPDLGGFDSIRLYKEHTIDGEFGKSLNELDKNRTFCPKLNDTLIISANGTISRCNHIWETEEANINNRSIEEVWNSSCLHDIRINYPDQTCLKCDQWTGHTQGESWRMNNGKIEHIDFNNA